MVYLTWYGDTGTRRHGDPPYDDFPLPPLPDFILLDRSRGPWGEPADDVTALAINYLFYSIQYFGDVRGPYLEGIHLFFDEYRKASGDEEIAEVCAPLFCLQRRGRCQSRCFIPS